MRRPFLTPGRPPACASRPALLTAGELHPHNLLEKFYSNPERYAFTFQNYVLLSRIARVGGWVGGRGYCMLGCWVVLLRDVPKKGAVEGEWYCAVLLGGTAARCTRKRELWQPAGRSSAMRLLRGACRGLERGHTMHAVCQRP